eukprot:CAMPEP_0184293790 /NCGR_PEP_ID=MMETSP1049-20130417/5136_1 /TAXON_ID=77928 /ORGANISM="Proteomonas sulcata, Strain CCMP704" /LENGTH=47 /DNA_ID= /DNA_START= /DNA_END= /DNA_ORIENTATION=
MSFLGLCTLGTYPSGCGSLPGGGGGGSCPGTGEIPRGGAETRRGGGG